MHVQPSNHPGSPRHQRGVALIISLILLVITTLLGLAAIRSITQEERMAGQSYARSLAFQATESALRQAETLVGTNMPMPTTSACAVISGVMTCPTPAVADTPRWDVDSAAYWTDLSAVGTGVLAITPQYFVEYLGSSFPCDPQDNKNNLICKRYRITARSAERGVGTTAAVMLQSVYATD
ncbi:pilus assembly PilX family protein [Rhodoferax antarcticus]|uniref:pilus assembly PilX family protein n=1 Tax=Rhodoferax antarcticus TaxID=81479 RepID=UPI0022244722|nr:PilX N-terminal domain-containing pilus assembly protein [Rhodoferax antarcticus]MCW2314230.1 type IV pilus assembly protein PilX [Rhodoferax antarcticus]